MRIFQSTDSVARMEAADSRQHVRVNPPNPIATTMWISGSYKAPDHEAPHLERSVENPQGGQPSSVGLPILYGEVLEARTV